LSESIVNKGGEVIIDRKKKEADFSKVKTGDVLAIYTGGGSRYQSDADKYGDGNTHAAFVSRVNPDGSFEMQHNVHIKDEKEWYDLHTKYKGKAFTGHVNPDGTINGSNYVINKVTRPAYEKVNTSQRELKYSEDVNLVSNGRPEEQALVQKVNKTKNDIFKTYGLTEEEGVSLSQAVFGIIEQETKFGNLTPIVNLNDTELNKLESEAKRKAVETAATVVKRFQSAFSTEKSYHENEEASTGLARVKKHLNFTDKELEKVTNLIGDNGDDEAYVAYVLTMALMAKNYARLRLKKIDGKEINLHYLY